MCSIPSCNSVSTGCRRQLFKAKASATLGNTSSVLSRLITVTVETGLIVAVGASVQLCFFIVYNTKDLYFLPWAALQSSLFLQLTISEQVCASEIVRMTSPLPKLSSAFFSPRYSNTLLVTLNTRLTITAKHYGAAWEPTSRPVDLEPLCRTLGGHAKHPSNVSSRSGVQVSKVIEQHDDMGTSVRNLDTVSFLFTTNYGLVNLNINLKNSSARSYKGPTSVL